MAGPSKSGMFNGIAERYRGQVVASAPAPVWRSHQEEALERWRDRERRGLITRGSPDAGCEGALRWIDRDDIVWVAECDACGHTVSVRRADVDPEFMRSERLRLAKLPARFLDEPVPAHEGNAAARQHLRVLIEQWGSEHAPRPPMLVGPNGRGKSHLVARAAKQLIEAHLVRCRFIYWADLVAEAREAIGSFGSETPGTVFERAATTPLLILDDIGTELQTDWALQMFERLINRRYAPPRAAGSEGGEPEQLPLMGTTNVPVAQWDQVFGAAAASRLHELTQPIEVTGPDWRRS